MFKKNICKLGGTGSHSAKAGSPVDLRNVSFYDSINNQTYLNIPVILYFLERGAQPTGTVQDISKRAGVFMELSSNQQTKFH